MNEEIAAEILKWLKGIGDTVTEQAPLLAEEIIAFGWVSTAAKLLWVVLFLVAAVACHRLAKYFWKKQKDAKQNSYSDPDWGAFAVGSHIACGFLSLITFVIAFDTTLWFLKLTFAPRLYVIEQVARMVQ